MPHKFHLYQLVHWSISLHSMQTILMTLRNNPTATRTIYTTCTTLQLTAHFTNTFQQSSKIQLNSIHLMGTSNCYLHTLMCCKSRDVVARRKIIGARAPSKSFGGQ